MKKFFFCLFLFLLTVLLVGCSIGTFAFPFGGSKYDPGMLTVSETNKDTYYLRKAPEKITFNISSNDPHAEPEYSITDSSGNVVSSNTTTSSNTFDIVAPENGYVPGERYTLTLGENTVFTDENLKDAQTLVFSIDRDPVENYEFTELVKEQSSVISEISDTVVSMDGLDAVQGDIIFGKDAADDYVAYKIEEILSDGTATVSAPALDEIYSALEVYGDYRFDVSDIVANSDLEAEIEENIRKSDFFNLLSTTAYAVDSSTDPFIRVKIEPKNDDSDTINIDVEIILLPDRSSLFNIEGLKNHAIKINLNFTLNLTSHFNIQSTKNWDISTTSITSFTWNVEISKRLYSPEDLSSFLQGLLPSSYDADSDDTAKHVKAVTEILSDIFEDTADGEIILFDWPLPIAAIPGLNVNVQTKMCIDLSLYIRANIGNELTWEYTVGSTFIDKKFDTYSSIEYESDNLIISMGGKLKTKLGLRLDIMVQFIDDAVAHIRIGPEAGVYAEAFATLPLVSDKTAKPTDYRGCYFEPGIYFNISAGAYINYLIGDVEYEFEIPVKRIPFEKLILGDEIIPLGISPIQESMVVIADKVTPPDFQLEFFDVEDGVFSNDAVDPLGLSFSLEDGTVLELDSEGRIVLPDDLTVQSENTLYATYTHSDGQEHATAFKILCGDLTITTEYFTVLLPQDWLDKYVAEYTDTGAIIFEKENYLISDGALGELVSVDLWSADEDYSYLPNYEYKDSCVVDGDEYDILAVYPSDVQFYDPVLVPIPGVAPTDKDCMSLYLDLSNDLYEDRENRDNSTDHLRVKVKNEYSD